MNYASESHYSSFLDYNSKPLNAFWWIKKETLTIFDNLWFDENGIKFFNLASVFDSYQTVQDVPESITLRGYSSGFLLAFF